MNSQTHIDVFDVSLCDFELIVVNYPTGKLHTNENNTWYTVKIAETEHSVTWFKADEAGRWI